MTIDPSRSGLPLRQVLRPREQVEQQLREAILGGLFAPGDKLPSETELAKQFGVSRPTIREALMSLVSGGLIRKVPGATGGGFVNGVNPDSLSKMLRDSMDGTLRLGTLSIGELIQVRRVLENPAARWAAKNGTRQHLDELHAIVEFQCATTIDDPRVPAYDLAFHTIIAQASGNRLLAAFVTAVHGVTDPVEYLEVTPEVARNTVKQHIAIVAALDARNPAEAADAMEAHLEYVLRHSNDYPKQADARPSVTSAFVADSAKRN